MNGENRAGTARLGGHEYESAGLLQTPAPRDNINV